MFNLISGIDKTVFLSINQFAGVSPNFDRFIGLLVNEYFIPVSLSLILFGFWFFKNGESRLKNKKAAILAFISIIMVNLAINLIDLFFQRPRPFDIMTVNLLYYKPVDPSFPSNPAAVGFALALPIFWANKKFGIISAALAVLFAVSRVIAGVQYPLDVLAGASLGIASFFLVLKADFLVDPLFNLSLKIARNLNLA